MDKKTLVKTSKKMGRPRVAIDWELFNKIVKYYPTESDLCGIFNCSRNALLDNVKRKYGMTFSAYRKQKSKEVKYSLIRKAMQMALEGGNNSMMIFALKNVAGWSDQGPRHKTMEYEK